MGECEKECVFNSNNECWLACKNKFYNQALEDMLAKVKSNHYLLSDKINSTDYGMFTCGIEQIAEELKR